MAISTEISPVQQIAALLAASRHDHLCNWPSWVLIAVRHEAACLPSVGQCLPPWHTRWRGKAGSIVCSEHRCSCSPKRSGDQNVGHICRRLLRSKQRLQCNAIIVTCWWNAALLCLLCTYCSAWSGQVWRAGMLDSWLQGETTFCHMGRCESGQKLSSLSLCLWRGEGYVNKQIKRGVLICHTYT